MFALTASDVGMLTRREAATAERVIPVKAPPTTSSRPQPGNYAASSAETTELPVGLPLGRQDLRVLGQQAMPMGMYSGRIEYANTRGSFGPSSGSNVWNTGV